VVLEVLYKDKSTKKVNRNDVAEKAGVSVATVSRVFSGNDYVSEKNRKLVLETAEEIGYRPNPVARSLKNNKTHQLMYYVRDLSNYYYMEMYKGMMDYAASKDYRFILSGDLNYEQINSLMIDGLVLPVNFFHSSKFTEGLRIPIVSASYSKVEAVDEKHVLVDSSSAMKLAIDHLLNLGHSKIAYVDLYRYAEDGPRKTSFLEYMKPYLDDKCEDYILGLKEFSESKEEINYMEIGRDAAKDFIKEGLDATAVICFNDAIAIGFMGYIQEKGIRVPDDLSIVGIDGQQQGNYSSPPLTSVSLDPFHHGSECARILINLIENKKTESVPVEINLISRGSTRAL